MLPADENDFFRAVFEALSAPAAILGADGFVVAVNEAWNRFARENGGDPGRTGVGVSYLDVCREARGPFAEGAREVASGLAAVLAGSIPTYSAQYPCPSPTRERWFLMWADRLPGPFRGAVTMHQDITSVKKQEQALAASESRYRSLFTHNPDAVWSLSTEGRFQAANPACERVTGYTSAELRNLKFSQLVAAADRERSEAHLERTLRGQPQHFEMGVVHRSGERVELNVTSVPLMDDGSQLGAYMLAQDVTLRRRAERQLAEAQSLLLLAEIERKQFYRNVIRAVTRDRFQLVEAGELPASDGVPLLSIPISDADSYARGRSELREIAGRAGMDPETVHRLVTAFGEAATNAIKHATRGRMTVTTTPERVIVRVTDEGPGIGIEDLPSAILQPGFTTAVSLGLGYTLMLEMVDRIWLATGPGGTTVQLEQWISPTERQLRLPPFDFPEA